MCATIKPPAALGEEKGRCYCVHSLHSKKTKPKRCCLNSVIFRVLSEWTGIQTCTGLPGWLSSPQLSFYCIPHWSGSPTRCCSLEWWYLRDGPRTRSIIWGDGEWARRNSVRVMMLRCMSSSHWTHSPKYRLMMTMTADILRGKMGSSSHIAWWELAWNIRHLCINCFEIRSAIHILTISELSWVKTF